MDPEDAIRNEPVNDFQKAAWQAPQLIVEDIEIATQGGPFTAVGQADDGWYT